MNGQYIERIIEMVGDPSSESLFDPGSVEQFIGRSLPSDYVFLMQSYESVVSNDEDETVRISVSGIEELGAGGFLESRNQSIFYTAERVSGFRIEGEEGRMVDSSTVLSRSPFNIFTIGEISGSPLSLFYDQDFCNWSVVISRGEYWWQFKGGVCELLVKMGFGDIEIPYMEDFFSQGVSFSRG